MQAQHDLVSLLSSTRQLMTRQITYAELCQHKSEEDLWLVINGKGVWLVLNLTYTVYDVTKFLSEVGITTIAPTNPAAPWW